MPTKREVIRKVKSIPALRASISFPPDLYRNLEQIAKQKKVSVAWVVRDATEKYVADHLLHLRKDGGDQNG